ncbi:MAG TPA: tryptophan synthase subunit alpha [Chthoniobacterales bacterium]|jgi:tryptophan synthase alpha chain|nr:tryptophan synthase subunit alpha [Chthoniobacterales bacterium]
MGNRIDECFATLRARDERAFIAYICAGDPSLGDTVDIAIALEKAGTDILELGIPFSDPLADGVVNQLAAQRALRAGSTLAGVLDCVRAIRQRSAIPIVLYSYLNPIFQFGWDAFHREAKAAGVDGLLILDLPPEEDPGTEGPVHIRLVAPTTPPGRIKAICEGAAGFIYYVSREGVTGAQSSVSSSLGDRLREIRAETHLPIAVGFGISTPDQAREVARFADAVVVGSAIVQRIGEEAGHADLPAAIGEYVRSLIVAVKQARAEGGV